MKKDLWVFVIIILVSASVTYSYTHFGQIKNTVFQEHAVKEVQVSELNIATTTIESTASESVSMPLVDTNELFLGEIADRFSEETYSVKNENVTISFGPAPHDTEHMSRNPGFQVYINEQKIGEVGGQGIQPLGFISNDNYFIVRTRSNNGCAGLCQSFGVYLIDLNQKSIKWIGLPKNESEYTGQKEPLEEILPFVTKYKVGTGDEPRLLFFFLLLKDGQYYQASSPEIWEYDVSSGMYKASF